MFFRAAAVIALFMPVFQAGCAAGDSLSGNSAPATRPATDQKGRPVLACNLDETAFKAALVGEWISAYEYPGNHIKHLSLAPDGSAVVIFVQNGTEQTVKGVYSINVFGPTSPNRDTLAEITVKSSNGDALILSQVNFGYHNAVHIGSQPILRIDKPPYGALMREPDK